MSIPKPLEKLEYTLADVRRLLSLSPKELRAYIADGRARVILRKSTAARPRRRKRVMTHDDLMAFHDWLTAPDDRGKECPTPKRTGRFGTSTSGSKIVDFSALSRMKREGRLPGPSAAGGPKNEKP